MGESTPSTASALHGLAIEAVEWLPSGAESGLVRVRGRWSGDLATPGTAGAGDAAAGASGANGATAGATGATAGKPYLPALVVRAAAREHRFESLPDTRFGRDPAAWRGSYLVPAALVTSDPEALWLQWPGGERAELPGLVRDVETPSVEGPADSAPAPGSGGAQVIDRAVLAERRARRAEAAEEVQTRIAAEALEVIEVLELRAVELERQLVEASAQPQADAGVQAALRERDAELESERRHGQELETALAEARHALAHARDQTDSRIADAEAAAASAEARLRVEAVARAALEDELDRERAARAPLAADLEAALGARAAAEADLAASRADLAVATSVREAAAAELAMARTELDDRRAEASAAEQRLRAAADEAAADAAAAQAELVEERAARSAVESALAGERAARSAAESALAVAREAAERNRAVAERAGATLQDRIAALDRTGAALPSDRLERVGREHAAATAPRAPARTAVDLAARLDVAATALRASTAPVGSDAITPAGDRHERESPEPRESAPPAVVPSPPGAGPSADESSPSASGDESSPTAALSPPVVGESSQTVAPENASPSSSSTAAPAVLPDGGSSPRPSASAVSGALVLRRALVRLAEDDPGAAGRLLVALLPGQAAVVDEPLTYDLTIRGIGLYAVTLAGGTGRAEPLSARRSRRVAAFHLMADPRTLAELLAGEDHGIGRLTGAARFRGRRRRLRALRPLATSRIALAELVRAGARVEPGAAWRMLGIAVRPAWTRGMHFTIAQVVTGPEPETWYLTARDGAGLAVTSGPPPQPPAATVSMSPTAFDRLLREEPYSTGDRPSVRGDRAAVTTLLALADRARH